MRVALHHCPPELLVCSACGGHKWTLQKSSRCWFASNGQRLQVALLRGQGCCYWHNNRIERTGLALSSGGTARAHTAIEGIAMRAIAPPPRVVPRFGISAADMNRVQETRRGSQQSDHGDGRLSFNDARTESTQSFYRASQPHRGEAPPTSETFGCVQCSDRVEWPLFADAVVLRRKCGGCNCEPVDGTCNG